MPHLKGGGDLTTGEGGGQEARRGGEDGEGAEGGQKSSLDGKPEGARLGAAGSMPHAVVRRRSRLLIANTYKYIISCFDDTNFVF